MMTLAIKKDAADSIHEIDLIFTFTPSHRSEHDSAFLFYNAFHERVNTNPAITVRLAVYDEHFTADFKSGVTIEIEG